MGTIVDTASTATVLSADRCAGMLPMTGGIARASSTAAVMTDSRHSGCRLIPPQQRCSQIALHRRHGSEQRSRCDSRRSSRCAWQ